jgi:carbon storage regulator
MLILTRKIGETVRIGDNITVKVLALRGGQISLGFTAPNDVRIFREEVLCGTAAAPTAAAPTIGEPPLAPPPRVRPTQPKPPARARLDSSSARNSSDRQS